MVHVPRRLQTLDKRQASRVQCFRLSKNGRRAQSCDSARVLTIKQLTGVSMKEVKVWECKIVVSADSDLPNGFDLPPRMAAIGAIEAAGVAVLGCSSGWGGSLTKVEQEAFEASSVQAYPDIYFAGAMDANDDVIN